MSSVPSRPKIYHITHVDNLVGIVASGELISDSKRIASGLTCLLVGMSTIKKRRLEEIKVTCYPETTVGQYVPHYFCPRSIMLYILHMGNHPDVSYRGGQQPMIHLQSDLEAVIGWTKTNEVPWAFSDGNASAYWANFYNDPSDLSKINWSAIESRDFRDPKTKDGKQAEFLVFGSFPWTLVEKIGAINSTISTRVQQVIASTAHQPVVAVQPNWYY